MLKNRLCSHLKSDTPANENWLIRYSETWLYTYYIHFLINNKVDSENGGAGGIFDSWVQLWFYRYSKPRSFTVHVCVCGGGGGDNFKKCNTLRYFYCVFRLQNTWLFMCHFPLALLVFCKKLVTVWSTMAIRGKSKMSALSNSSGWLWFSSRLRLLAKPSLPTQPILVFQTRVENNLLALYELLRPPVVVVNVIIGLTCFSFCPFCDLQNWGKTSSTFHLQMFSWTCLCFALSS